MSMTLEQTKQVLILGCLDKLIERGVIKVEPPDAKHLSQYGRKLFDEFIRHEISISKSDLDLAFQLPHIAIDDLTKEAIIIEHKCLSGVWVPLWWALPSKRAI